MNEPLSQSDAMSDAIARELEQLGEGPLSADELAMLAGEDLAGLDEFEPAVASTARLIELSRPYVSPDLSEIDKQRVWRGVEQRRAGVSSSTTRSPEGRPSRVPEGRPSRVPEGRRSWAPWVAVALAIAAAVALAVIPRDETGPSVPSAIEVAEVGEQARSALRALDDGLSDTARAEQLSHDYQRRLETGR